MADPISSSMVTCGSCGAIKDRMPKCSRCKRIYYCDAECQKNAWKAHKLACKILAPLPEDVTPVWEIMGHDGSTSPLTQRQFKDLTGGTAFSPWWHADSVEIIDHAQQADGDLDDRSISTQTPDGLALVKRFEEHPPRLFLRKHSTLRLEVVSGQIIPSGEITCLYTGDLLGPREPNRKEVLRSFCGTTTLHTSGKGSFFNDGFPNCGLGNIGNYGGFPQAPAIFALRDIGPGEALFYDYGPDHPVKRGIYLIDPQNYKRIEAFCQSPKMYNPQTSLELLQFAYILNTAYIFIRLHLKKTLDPARTLHYLEKASPIINNFDTPPFFYNSYSVILETIVLLFTKSPGLIQPLLEIQDCISARAFVQVLQAPSLFENPASNLASQIRDVGLFLDALHIYVYGDLLYVTIEKTSEDSKEDSGEFLLQYPCVKNFSSLPKPLQAACLRTIEPLAKTCYDEGLFEKGGSLTQLRKKLPS